MNLKDIKVYWAKGLWETQEELKYFMYGDDEGTHFSANIVVRNIWAFCIVWDQFMTLRTWNCNTALRGKIYSFKINRKSKFALKMAEGASFMIQALEQGGGFHLHLSPGWFFYSHLWHILFIGAVGLFFLFWISRKLKGSEY